ncbi:hypothetical protein DFH07DRAFT_864425 [Mycena maculata]|uniref:RING-type domain-containing protein n=1 Tax=Mycena maculata TaxID=230809 RepID=A0AAD7KKF4_9AGAR|nr:hypothetical protein DFH07DRAFT_864425 [Mycena maculata]
MSSSQDGPQPEAYDLLIVTDATASMGGYLDSLRESIPEILALAKLSGAFNRLGVLAYKDYTDPVNEIAAWSGWNAPKLTQFVHELRATGGGDFPEAAKTALIRGLQAVDKKSKTLMLWYADAPPHHASIQSHQNDVVEAKAFPAGAVDWVKLCHTARRRNCTVFSFVPRSLESAFSAFYVLLSALTGGICIASNAAARDSALMSRLTLGVILQWMGQGTTGMDEVLCTSSALLLRYEQSPLTANPKLSDELLGSHGYLPPSRSALTGARALLPIIKAPLELSDIPVSELIPQSLNLGKRFGDPAEAAYRDLVYESLTSIIRTNVACLTYNPIFGQLWRAVCKDTGPRKPKLVDLFSEYVGNVEGADKKAALRQWLEDSFDQTEEIEGIIARHCANGPTPMVYLDFDADVQLDRTELLEVSRSCYAGVLKKIARVFTHLKLVEPGITLAPLQRSIPLTLPPRDFYRILPHLIVPGTLYPPRAAALTAIVSLVTGVPFLAESATALLATTKGKWLDLEVPENISFDCARLLLSAPAGVVLTQQERTVYEAMRRYKLIELNLHAPLVVHVPWTPQKTRGPGDEKVQCKRCSIQRSATIMSHQDSDLCGFCVTGKGLPVDTIRANFPGVDEAESCWVECSTKSCRAQYVVENVAGLRIRPRCYYCRNNKPCPWLECSVCTNRIIVPRAFRTTSDVSYICPACTNPAWAVKCIVEAETSVRALNGENGVGWLGFPAAHAAEILGGKSAFKLMQACGADVFGHTPAESAPPLVLGGKALRGTAETLAAVEARVGRGEVVLASCALCFEDMPRSKLGAACGRTGCSQLVDDACLHEWYGQNAPGNLLNMMQLTCPFCRRPPAAKTLARYNRRAAVLGGLKDAMADRRWLYAWCTDCACAKRAFERTACTEERLAPVSGFRCEDCREPRRRTTPVVCPNLECGYAIEKVDGCNHILCVCGTHFCYVCGKEFTQDTIYGHMQSVHGSIYDDY